MERNNNTMLFISAIVFAGWVMFAGGLQLVTALTAHLALAVEGAADVQQQHTQQLPTAYVQPQPTPPAAVIPRLEDKQQSGSAKGYGITCADGTSATLGSCESQSAEQSEPAPQPTPVPQNSGSGVYAACGDGTFAVLGSCASSAP
ncbi:MAG: hypothetical protein HC828_21730, partial [Blastochloris sp.]|nr:hypothetical protein [Blastochloris sp.]